MLNIQRRAVSKLLQSVLLRRPALPKVSRTLNTSHSSFWFSSVKEKMEFKA